MALAVHAEVNSPGAMMSVSPALRHVASFCMLHGALQGPRRPGAASGKAKDVLFFDAMLRVLWNSSTDVLGILFGREVSVV